MDLAQFHAIFFDECDELLAQVDRHLQGCAEAEGVDLVREVKRTAHSIKGGARTFGFTALADLAAAVESKLEAMNVEGVDLAGLDLCVRGFDLIKTVVSTERAGRLPPNIEVDSMLAELGRGERGQAVANAQMRATAAPPSRRYQVAFRQARTLVGAEWVVEDMLDTLHRMAEVKVETRPAPDDSDGSWCLELCSVEDEATLIHVLGRVADPDSLCISPADDVLSRPRSASGGPVQAERSRGESVHLLIRLAAHRYAVRADDIMAVRAGDTLHALTGLPDKVRGLVWVDGQFVPWVDLHDWVDAGRRPVERFAPQLMIRLEHGLVCVRVDDVEDVLSVPVDRVQMPQLLADIWTGIAPSGWLLHHGQALAVLDLRSMLNPFFRDHASVAGVES